MRHGAAARLQAARRGKCTRHALRAHAEAAELAPCVEVPNPNPNLNPNPWLQRPKPIPNPNPNPKPKGAAIDAAIEWARPAYELEP